MFANVSLQLSAGFSKKFQVENIIFFIFKFGLTQDKKSGNKILIL